MAIAATPTAPAGADGNEAPAAPLVYRSITSGYAHSCALLDDGTVRCWGRNDSGQLGLGSADDRGDGFGEMGTDLPPVPLGSERTATALSAGSFHTCALLDDGSVKCWGRNHVGQLGLGDTDNRGDEPGEMGDDLPAVDLGTGRTATAITAADASHTCALLDDGALRCWGDNEGGQLGLGDLENRGDEPGEMGDDLPAVDLGTGRTATASSTGGYLSCAVLDDATVKCWGGNDAGQLGLGDTAIRGDQPGEMGDDLPAVDLGTGRTADAVSVGHDQVCALLDDGAVKCWGRNDVGQLGLGDTAFRGDQPGEMGDDLPAVDLGTGRTAEAVAAGFWNTCVLLDDSTVKCWGANDFGGLGLGDTTPKGDGGGEMGDDLATVELGTGRTAMAITAGHDGACVVLDRFTVKCWGRNHVGQLGLGDTADRGDEAGEMGDTLPVLDLPGSVASPVADVTASLAADQGRVVAGDAIDYHLTITNTGGVLLRGVRVIDLDVPDCAGPVPNIAVGASRVVDCSYTTTADDVPMMTNQALVTTAEGTLALSGNRRTHVDAQHRQPDALIAVGAGLPVGNGIYNSTGAGQAKSVAVPNQGTARFTVRVQNDGNVTDTFAVSGLGTTSRFTVTYKDGATVITPMVVAGTFTLADLAPGDTHDITVVMKARTGAPAGSRLSRTLTVTSPAGGARDAVKATIVRR